MTQKDWAIFFLGVLKEVARDKTKSQEARLYLCQFFHGLLCECLTKGKLSPKDIKISAVMLERLERLAQGKVSPPRRKKVREETPA